MFFGEVALYDDLSLSFFFLIKFCALNRLIFLSIKVQSGVFQIDWLHCRKSTASHSALPGGQEPGDNRKSSIAMSLS